MVSAGVRKTYYLEKLRRGKKDMLIGELKRNDKVNLVFKQGAMVRTFQSRVRFIKDNQTVAISAVFVNEKPVRFRDGTLSVEFHSEEGGTLVFEDVLVEYVEEGKSQPYYRITSDKEGAHVNRRGAVRVATRIQCVVKRESQEISERGLLQNLSATGARVHFRGLVRMSTGDNIVMGFIYGTDRVTYRVQGVIKRVGFSVENNSTRVGIEFVNPSDDISRLVNVLQMEELKKRKELEDEWEAKRSNGDN